MRPRRGRRGETGAAGRGSSNSAGAKRGNGAGRPRLGKRKGLACILLVVAYAGCGGGTRCVDLWLTPDQQGQRAFDRGEYEVAARMFEDPLWKGTALYLSRDFEAALVEFAKVDTAQGWFNRGNALAHQERYQEATEAYRKALELWPEYAAAKRNLEYLEPFLPLEFEGGEMGTVGRDAAADEIVFDADRNRLDEQGIDTVMEGEQQALSDQQLAEVWLRQVDTSPASFLRYKFAFQAQSSGAPGSSE